jgi:hypothetical protein
MIKKHKKASTITLRKFPYPYRAAFSISSDIDYCPFERFIEIHQFLNHPSNGIGLPVADSFFGTGMGETQLGYFKEDGKTITKDAPFIRDAIKAGLIDSLHSWGDFNKGAPTNTMVRRIAENLTNHMVKHGLKIPLWVNHGAPCNRQNLYSPIFKSYNGDNPESGMYTADLFPALGITYFCPSPLISWPVSMSRENNRIFLNGIRFTNVVTNSLRLLTRRKKGIKSYKRISTLALPLTLRNGTRIWNAIRYNNNPSGLWHATRDTLHYALSPPFFNLLIRSEGYVILFVHLGLPIHKTDGQLFTPANRHALALLAKCSHLGYLWVHSTSAILRYFVCNEYIQWDYSTKGNETIIRLLAINDPIKGKRIPTEDECAGITFYTPSPGTTSIIINDKRLRIIPNPPDHTNCASVSIPLPHAPLIDFFV